MISLPEVSIRGYISMRGELLASPLSRNGACVDEIWGWQSWWDSRLEYAVGGSDSNLADAINLFALGARTLTQTNHVHQKGQPHTVEDGYRMCTENGTAHVPTAVPW